MGVAAIDVSESVQHGRKRQFGEVPFREHVAHGLLVDLDHHCLPGGTIVNGTSITFLSGQMRCSGLQ